MEGLRRNLMGTSRFYKNLHFCDLLLVLQIMYIQLWNACWQTVRSSWIEAPCECGRHCVWKINEQKPKNKLKSKIFFIQIKFAQIKTYVTVNSHWFWVVFFFGFGSSKSESVDQLLLDFEWRGCFFVRPMFLCFYEKIKKKQNRYEFYQYFGKYVRFSTKYKFFYDGWFK